MAIKTTIRNGSQAGRGDQPYDFNSWHPSMGEPKTATGGGGKKPPTKKPTKTGGNGENPYDGMGKKKSGTGQSKKPKEPYDYNTPMHPSHVLPQKKVSRDMHSQSDQIMKKGNVYNVPDSYWKGK